MGWQQARDIGLHALLHLCGERQSPIVEQAVIYAWRTVLIGAKVTNQQDLSALLDAISPTLTVTVLNARLMPTAKAVGLAMQPGKPVLRTQTGEAMAEQARGKPLQQRHFSQGAQFGG
jgi:hypothetical protein